MSENLTDLEQREKNLKKQSNNKRETIDMDKFNTYSNNKIDENKKYNFGLNEVLDIGKYSSKSPSYKNEIKENRFLVDELFDESINNETDRDHERNLNLNINNEILKDTQQTDNNVHLFTESAQDQSIRDSDIFGFDNKLNVNFEKDKYSNKQFNYDNVLNIENDYMKKDFDNINDHENNINVNSYRLDNIENKNYLNSILNEGINSENISSYKNIPIPCYSNNLNAEEKNQLISRLFSDNNYTENDLVSNLNDSINDKKNYLKNSKIDPNTIPFNFNNDLKKKIKNPFDDTEDYPQVNSLMDQNELNKISDNNLSDINDRISFNNPNFIFGNINESNRSNNENLKVSNLRDTGNDIISKFNDRPFKSINFEENNEHENSINEQKNENVDNINIFDINSFRDDRFKNENKLKNDENGKNEINEKIDRNNQYLENNRNDIILNSFKNSPKKFNMENTNKSIKISKDDIGDFNLLGDDSKEDLSFHKLNSFNNKNNAHNNNNILKSSSKNILEEIDLEIDNDRIIEDDNYNLNFGMTINTIKNFNDLEMKNKLVINNFNSSKTNENKNIDILNFNSKDFKNFEANINNNKNVLNQQRIFDDENFDFESNNKNENNSSKGNNAKLNIKLNNNLENNQREKIDPKLNLFKNFEIDNKLIKNSNNFHKSNYDYEKAVNSNQDKKINFNISEKTDLKTNQILSANNIKNNNFNIEIKNSQSFKNIEDRLSNNIPNKIAYEDYHMNDFQEKFPNKESNNKNSTAEDLMKKNQNINFDKIIFDVFDKNEKVHFDKEYDVEQSFNYDKKDLLPPDYINLDDFESNKMNEYNNYAVNKNMINSVDINFLNNEIKNPKNFPKDKNNNNQIENENFEDSLYIQANQDEKDENDEKDEKDEKEIENDGLFNRFSKKFEQPFGNISKITYKKNYLKRQNKIKNDNLFSSEKSFGKIKFNLDFSLKKYFAYDQEVLKLQIEAFFIDLLQKYDFDSLKKKLNYPTKDLKLKSESKISYLQNLQSLIINTDLVKINPAKLKVLESNLKFIREIKSDGNGFYRAFMFSLIEKYILNKNIFGLRNIIYDISENIDKSLDKNNVIINKYEIFGVFNCILENIENNDITSAYSVLINAYGFSSNFDNCMIKYMRNAIKNFISFNETELFKTSKYPHIIGTFPEEFQPPTEKENLNSFYKDHLSNFNNEADLFVICLAPLVFENGLDLFIIEGINKENFDETNVFIQQLPSLNENPENQIFVDNVKILYRQGRFSVIYSNDIMKKFDKYMKLEFDKFVNNERYKEKIRIISEFTCEDCKKDSEIIQIKNLNDLSFCKNCLKSFLKEQAEKRGKDLITENFVNAEYYSRPFIIDEKGKYEINDDDFMFLFNCTIPKMVYSILMFTCSVCQNQEDPHKLIKLNCSCSFCEKCLMNYIDKATEGKIILNVFEKTTIQRSGINSLLCPCGLSFETELAISKKYPDQNVLRQKANMRLITICENLCIYCLNDLTSLKSKKILPGENLTFHILKLKPDNVEDLNISNHNHIICNNCCSGSLKNHFGNLIKKKIIKINDVSYPIGCSICNVLHKVNSANLKKIFKSQGGCCEIL